ncbi:hypothetical protein DFH09DRAFT_1361865 [Mycena vulgaris]|nr:hypothetical protein DFH09DRAFT_1361865 [Mycena vulgaris]
MPRIIKKKCRLRAAKLKIENLKSFKIKSLAEDDWGLQLRELELSFKTMEHKMLSARAGDVAKLLRCTPNLTKLTLGFSGHMNTYADCMGQELMDALCALENLEEFTQRAMTRRQTEIGFSNLMRLASSWPKLRVLYVSADLESTQDAVSLPPVTCALQHVTLEACTANLDHLELLFAGSATSLKTLEVWTMGTGTLDAALAHVLYSLESLKVGGCNHPSPTFLRDQLSTAPRLHTLQLGGDPDRNGRVRAALTTGLVAADPARLKPLYRALKYLGYPARAPLAKENAPGAAGRENIGEAELRGAAAARGIAAVRAPDLLYRGELRLRKTAETWRTRADARAEGK